MTGKLARKQTDRIICDEGSRTLWQGIEHNGKWKILQESKQTKYEGKRDTNTNNL
jgi:hypothetical protein